MGRSLRIIQARHWLGLSHADRDRLLKEGYRPQMAGADDEPPAAGDPPAGDLPAGAGDPPEELPTVIPTSEEDGDTVRIPKKTLDALNRDLAETRRRERRAEEQRRKDDEKAKQEQGRFRELWESEKSRADALEARHAERDAAEAENSRRTRVSRRAASLHFHDPEDAFALLRQRSGVTDSTLDDDALVDHALTKLAEEKSYLVGKKPRSSGDITPGSNDPDDVPAGRSRIRHARRVA